MSRCDIAGFNNAILFTYILNLQVGAKKIECTPPDGMELKKFEI
jgi:hypothetical protein